MTKTKVWTVALCLGGMLLAGGGGLRADKLESQQWSEIRSKLQTEGWQQIAEGVFERRSGTKVEHMGYGREGLAWTIGELRRQLEVVMREYENNPSEDLAQIIDGLSIKIARAQQEIPRLPKAITSATEAVTVTGVSCGFCYSATVDAYYKTDVQGVGATAEAKFNNACGYSGETYAYAYATAVLNGTTVTHSQSDPDSGSSITSTAIASVNGGPTCSSYASAYSQSTALGISFSTSDSNNTCPVPPNPPVPTISGTTYESFTSLGSCRNKTWTVSTSGGTSPYSYVWKEGGVTIGTGTSYTRTICPYDLGFTLDVYVTDASSQTGTDSHSVLVYTEQEPCYQGGGMQVICHSNDL